MSLYKRYASYVVTGALQTAGGRKESGVNLFSFFTLKMQIIIF